LHVENESADRNGSAVDQAIFTSAQTRTRSGYQIIAASSGLTQEELAALAVWCPSHGALQGDAQHARSVNFHHLPSGKCCVSLSRWGGQEYSDRAGQRVWTHCLIAPRDVLRRFANNPFALLDAARARGVFDVQEDPQRLDRLALVGHASASDTAVIGSALNLIDPPRLCLLLSAITSQPHTAVQAVPFAEEIFKGLVNCLPVSCRSELTFATGVRHSPRRPFRLLAASSAEAGAQRSLAREQMQPISLFAPGGVQAGSLSPWSRQVLHLLQEGGPKALATMLEQAPDDLTLETLAATAALPSGTTLAEPPEANCERTFPAGGNRLAFCKQADRDRVQRPPLQAENQAAGETPVVHPLWTGAETNPMLEALESLDDMVYDAIGGDSESLHALRELWPRLRSDIAPDLLDESREQYLIYALSVWDKFTATGASPRLAAASLDVLHILLDDEDQHDGIAGLSTLLQANEKGAKP